MKNLENEVPNQMVAPPRIVMSVDLIFDAVNLKDSFMFEKLRFSVGDEFSMVAALLKERGYTVQPQTNGIIAAMLREGTRQVTFKWADMSFTGYLQEASARYTMFSVSGKPHSTSCSATPRRPRSREARVLVRIIRTWSTYHSSGEDYIWTFHPCRRGRAQA
jgi:hypothetical protein